jgi:hypothetical protein
MLKKLVAGGSVVVALAVVAVCAGAYGLRTAASEVENNLPPEPPEIVAAENGFTVEVLIHGSPVTEYAARGRRYVEALEKAEYELRIRNPSSARVAVALAVDGLNTIDARHTSAWEARKWVIEPYGVITIRGWQMSSDNARRFYFTSERDSYGAKLGQTANLGLISAVFFRERGQPVTIMPVTPAPKKPDYSRDDITRNESRRAGQESAQGAGKDAAKEKSAAPYPAPDEESAATGIGRSVPNGVRWIHMDLDPKAAGEVTIRYEYRAALVKLGILPRDYPRPNVLERREKAVGFEPKYCPQP